VRGRFYLGILIGLVDLMDLVRKRAPTAEIWD
jgi:hypothetical protein